MSWSGSKMKRSMILLVLLLGGVMSALGEMPRVLIWGETLQGTEEQELRLPICAAAASETEIAVADAHGPRLLLFRKTGVDWGLTRVVDLPGTPVGLTFDGSRYVASLRGLESLVALERESLQQRRVSLPEGVVPGPIASLDDDELLLYDYSGPRFLRIDPRGRVLGESQAPAGVTGLAAVPSGGFLASVPQRGALLLFDAQGLSGGTWLLPADIAIPAWPTGVVVEPGGDVVVVDRHAGRLLVLDGLGELIGVGARAGSEPGLLRYPAGIAHLPNGRLVVADTGNGRVQIFDRTDRSAN